MFTYKVFFKHFFFLSLLFFLSTSTSLASESGNIVTYEKNIKKIVYERCSSCHGSDSPTLEEFRGDVEGYKKNGKMPRIDTYEYLMIFITGEDMGALPKRLDDGTNTPDGKPGSMYVHLGDDDKERTKNLQLFKDWIGYWNVKTRHDITEEIDQEWLSDVLSGEDTDEISADDKINDILSHIKAPRS
jgi:hypothetical protein